MVLVTGSSSGLGFALAEYLVSEGYFVLGVDKDDISASLRCEENYSHHLCDLADQESIRTLVASLSQLEKIDVIINNAAIIRPSLFRKMDHIDFDQVMKVNLNGAVFLTQGLLPKLNASMHAPHVFNVGSTAGVVGAPYLTSYVCSKSAIHGFTLAINQENSFFGKVKATTLNFGPIFTPMNDSLEGWPGIWKENNPVALDPKKISQIIEPLIRLRTDVFVEKMTFTGRELNNDRSQEHPTFSH